jgi:hypothetical protein
MIAEKIGKEDFLRRSVERAMRQVLQTEITGLLAATVASDAGSRPERAVQSGSMEDSGGLGIRESPHRAEDVSAPWKYAARTMKDSAWKAGLGRILLAYIPAQLLLNAPRPEDRCERIARTFAARGYPNGAERVYARRRGESANRKPYSCCGSAWRDHPVGPTP